MYGLAKGYTKNIGRDAMIDRDNDAIAALTIMWELIKGLVPGEVVAEVNQHLKDANMPRMATRNVEPGMYHFSLYIGNSERSSDFRFRYHFVMGEKTYSFPDIERAPPEGYMSHDYVA